ncbi:IS66 family insertion sequence element accessory protein TnpB [[Ruminococcus] torques]
MSNKRAPGRSLDEWMELVTECRQSGLTDAAWCNEHGISPSCFYNAVTRLRKKACQIPDPVGKASTLHLTSHKQDVVQIAIEPESSPAGLIPDNGNSPMHLDNSHTIEIEADGLLIRMSNEIKPVLLKMLMDTLKESRMLADISSVDAIYIVCGRTDMRKSIDGLCAIIQEQFSMEIDHALFLFCGRKCDRIKAILKEPDGIVMIYKRLTAQGSYRWPRNKSEVRNLTWREFDWLMSGLDIEQPKAIKST